MRFIQGGFVDMVKRGEKMIEETIFDVVPPGCTCSPGPYVKTIMHDYIELEVSESCTAHAALMGNMTYDQYTKLKREYFSGRKRTDDDGKLLRAKEYTRREHEEIERARKRVQESMEKLRVLGDTWRSFSSKDQSNGTTMEIAQYVQKVRFERNEARHELHEAERDYRMSIEVPFLRRWKLGTKLGGVVEHGTAHESARRHNTKFDFLPWEPGMKIRFLDPMYSPMAPRAYSAEDQAKMTGLAGELKKLAAQAFEKKAVFRPMRETGLRRNLRRK